jgi:hypothetical protein
MHVSGLSPRTVSYAHAVLHTALEQTLETELRTDEQSLAMARQQIDVQVEQGIRRERRSRKFVNMAGANQRVVDPSSKYLIYVLKM